MNAVPATTLGQGHPPRCHRGAVGESDTAPQIDRLATFKTVIANDRSAGLTPNQPGPGVTLATTRAAPADTGAAARL